MKTAAYIFPLTALAIFIQAITGAATVLDFYGFDALLMSGYVVVALALVSTVVAFAVKPQYGALRYASVVLLVLLLILGALGVRAETSDQLVVAHFVNSLVIYGISIAMTFYAFRWGRAATTSLVPPQP